MASLSRLAKSKTDNNIKISAIGESGLESPPFINAPEYEEEPDEKAEGFKNILFISDTKLTQQVRSQLCDYHNISSYDKSLFQNRSCCDLFETHNVQNLWVNINSKNARSWLCSVLQENKSYNTVCVYSKSKHGKWLDDLKEHTDLVVSVDRLNEVKSLSMDDFSSKVAGLSLHLHAPPLSKMLSLCGLGSGRLSKKKRVG
jgi:hypothetical protein